MFLHDFLLLPPIFWPPLINFKNCYYLQIYVLVCSAVTFDPSPQDIAVTQRLWRSRCISHLASPCDQDTSASPPVKTAKKHLPLVLSGCVCAYFGPVLTRIWAVYCSNQSGLRAAMLQGVSETKKTSRKHPGLINVIKVRDENCNRFLEQRTCSDLSDDPKLTQEETVLYSFLGGRVETWTLYFCFKRGPTVLSHKQKQVYLNSKKKKKFKKLYKMRSI